MIKRLNLKALRILVCGSRYWTNRNRIMRELQNIGTSNIVCLIEGGAVGADSLGRSCGEELGIAILSFPADWKKYGSAAGTIRNSQMIREGKPDMVLAFHKDLRESVGTAHMVRIARAEDIMVKVIR